MLALDIAQIWTFFASMSDGAVSRRNFGGVAAAFGRQDHLWRPVVRHDPDERWYARLYEDNHYSAWLIGWEQGQSTRLHDHAGSAGAVYVAEGELTEDHADVLARRLRRRTHQAGNLFSFGASHVHDVRNETLVRTTSVHVYSPPLAAMTYYDRAPDGRLQPVETVLRDAWGLSSAERKMPGAEVG